MAYPTFVAAGAAISLPTGGTAANVEVPAGVAAGDLLLCVMLLGNGAGNTPTGPSGFTAIDSQIATLFSAGLHLYYKIAGGSEPGTYNVSQSGGSNLGAARMYAWTGTHATTPINVNSKSAVQNGVTTISLPSATTTVAECLHIGISFEYNIRTPTISATGSQTARGGSTLLGRVFQVTEEQIASAGAVTGKTHSSGSSGDFYGFSIGVAPAAGGGGITGTLATTEAADVAALTGDVIITGTIAATESADTAAFSGGSTPVTGDLDATEASDTAAAAGTVRNPRLVIGPLKNNTGTLLASETGATVYVYQTSGAHVVTKTSQTTNGSAIMTVSDAALAAGTTYRFVIVLSGGAEGMDKQAAA